MTITRASTVFATLRAGVGNGADLNDRW